MLQAKAEVGAVLARYVCLMLSYIIESWGAVFGAKVVLGGL